jgi:hypothetical protein
MNVVRLKAWVLGLLAPLAAAWRLRTRARAVGVTQSERALVAAASASPHRSGLATGTWLEDAHRLRARPLSRLGSAAPSREHIHQILHDPHWAAAYNAAQTEHFPRTAPTAEPRETEQYVRRSEQASRPLASSARQEDRESPSMSSLRERRRLVYVRELVRRGIYNEGFTPSTLPEQYRPRPDRDAGTGPLPLDE